MNKLDRLSALRQLTEAELLAAYSALAVLQTKENGLRDNLANLTAQKRQASLSAITADAAAAGGANIRWQKWADEKRMVINVELAAILGQRANAQAKTKRAFGKDQALAALIDREKKLLKKQLQRREL